MPSTATRVEIPTPAGHVRLIRMPQSRRFCEIRRRGSFAWALTRENAFTRAIDDHLKEDLAGAVAYSLIRRASAFWFADSAIPLAHDPNDVDRLEENVPLLDAARAVAGALRSEVNRDSIVADAERHLDGDFRYRTPWAIKVGGRRKAAPDLPEKCFGRLAPLGVTSLASVLPWLGFVPAKGVTDDHYWLFEDLPWGNGPEISVPQPDLDLWVRTRFRAPNRIIEAAAESLGVPAAVNAPQDLEEVGLRCDGLDGREPLAVRFAPGLRLAFPDGSTKQIRRILPLDVFGTPWDILPPETPGLDQLHCGTEVKLLWPFPREEFLHHLRGGKELVHLFLWLSKAQSYVPVDPWEYVILPKYHEPGHVTRNVTFFDLDETGFRTAVAERFATSNDGDSKELPG